MRIFVANAEDRIFTKLFPNNIALIIGSFFFNSFWVFIAFLSSSDTFFWIKGSDILVIAVSEDEKNPDKISKGMPDGRSFRVYGPLKELITKIIEGPLKEDISLIEKIINEKKAENPEADSKEHKVIDYMTQWIESKKKYLEVPEILQYTGLMTFSNLCFIERDTIRKASKKPKDDEKKK